MQVQVSYLPHWHTYLGVQFQDMTQSIMPYAKRRAWLGAMVGGLDRR